MATEGSYGFLSVKVFLSRGRPPRKESQRAGASGKQDQADAFQNHAVAQPLQTLPAALSGG